MLHCLHAIGTRIPRSVFKTAFLFLLPVFIFCFSLPAFSQEEDTVEDNVCVSAWPLSCDEGGGGSTGCGGWSVVKDLAENESLPGLEGTCSTGTRIAFNGSREQAQGQPVGAMFPGVVVFAQAGRSRDGRDYGGVVVIEMDEASPQCYLRYMFLDRRDLVEVGTEVKAGQRIGSIASDDMSRTNQWWSDNWPGVPPQIKVDMGCDEALLNLPHFMPRQTFGDWGTTDVEDPHTCSLTKARFPSRVLEYMLTLDDGGNTGCDVGIRKDARYQATPAEHHDDTEKELEVDNFYVSGAKPMNIIRRKETPVFAVFGHETLKQTLFGANRKRSDASTLFRGHKNYAHATNLRCENLDRIFRGQNGASISPEQVREYLAYCTNQHILTRGVLSQVHQRKQDDVIGDEEDQLPLANHLRLSPIPQHLVQFLSPEEQEQYANLLAAGATRRDVMTEMMPSVRKVGWRDQCQPLKMVPLIAESSYKVTDILHKSWEELLIDWPEARNLSPKARLPISPIELNDYTKYPYERINDPSHPFAPRHIFRETERERYSNYGVQCAATPVDIILGAYGEADDLKVFGDRAASFHQCIGCRIEINETKETCFADPFSYQVRGGCFGANGSGFPSGGEGLCTEFYDLNDQPIPGFLTYLNQLEDQYGLERGFLHATATVESSCRACPSPSDNCVTGNSFNAKGMFQFVYPESWGISDPYDPHDAAEGAAKYHSTYAQRESCDLAGTICAYNCGPACSNCGNSQTSGYVTKFQGFGITDACSPGGPYPDGSGTSGGGVPTSGGSGSGGSGLGDDDDDDDATLGSGGLPAGAGGFDPSGCPAGYVGNSNAFTADGNTCPALSYPTPDMPGPGTYGCHGRNFYPPSCSASCKARYDAACTALRGYYSSGGASRTSVCSSSSCPPRIHEGMDIAFEYGVPIYASADGVVSRVSDSGYVTIDHSGQCIDPGCTKRFPSGVDTRYYHLGLERVMVAEGQTVKRCDQVGSVGDKNTEGVPHLHYEAHNPNSVMTGSSSSTNSYWALAADEPYHSHIDDKSCTGGVWDGSGVLGGASGICAVALPVDLYKPGVVPPELKDDLPQPAYLTDYEASPLFSEVDPPAPASEGLSDPIREPYKHDVPGMVFNGVWTDCARLGGDDRVLCDYLDALADSEIEDEPSAGGSEGFSHPVPCTAASGSFGLRAPIASLCNAGINPDRYCNWHMHNGEDFGAATGTPIFAPADGVVIAGGGSGLTTTILHGDGTITKYMHQSQICPEASLGSNVTQGQVIGYVGNTGNSSGPHLHFEMHMPEPVDPMEHIPAHLTDAGQCAIINSARCGDTLTDLPSGPGISGGGGGPQICIDKPCSLKYNEADTVAKCAFPRENGGCGPLGHYSQRGEENSGGDCCFNITKPVPSLNVLKIRPGFTQEAETPFWTGGGRNPTFPRTTETRAVEHPILDYLQARGEWIEHYIDGAWDGARLVEEGGTASWADNNRGAPEAYTFYEHFRDHRPYIRWWDTGAESGHIYQGHVDAESTSGSMDTLVGVGVERQQCGYGGWGEPLNTGQRRCNWREGCFHGNVPGQENPDLLDGNTSWLELKLYQARATYEDSLHCIPRYERVYKGKGAEDFALHMSGGTFSTIHHGQAAAGAINFGWPLGWRGYASEKAGWQRFPWFDENGIYSNGAQEGMVGGGLDRALPGDILIWDKDVTGDNRLPHVAFVTRAYNDVIQEGTSEDFELSKKRFFPQGPRATPVPSVTVADYNFGKYPDTCGNTNWAGVAPDRTIYKTMPPAVSEQMNEADVNIQTCSNPDITRCVEPYWDTVKIYRPWRHMRH